MTDADRIRELERQVGELRRIVESIPVREAQTMHRHPILIGVLDEDLIAGDTATVSVWRQKNDGTFEDTGDNVEAADWLLVGGYKLETGNRVVLFREPHSKQWLLLMSNECPVLVE